MKIPSIGNYPTQGGQTAIVDAIGHRLCAGRVEPDYPYVVWNRDTGQAFVPPRGSAQPLSIVSPAPAVTSIIPGIEVASERQCEDMVKWVERCQKLTPATQRPPWYRLLAAGDTFRDEDGIVYTVVSVDESGRADIEWFSPSCKRLLRSQEHLSDRWIAVRSKPISVAAMNAPEVAQVAPWRERIIQLIETARRDPTGSGRLISGDVTFYMDCSRVTVFREASNNSRHTVYLKSPEIIGAFKARMTQLAAEAARAHDDAKATAIEALLQ